MMIAGKGRIRKTASSVLLATSAAGLM